MSVIHKRLNYSTRSNLPIVNITSALSVAMSHKEELAIMEYFTLVNGRLREIMGG